MPQPTVCRCPGGGRGRSRARPLRRREPPTTADGGSTQRQQASAGGGRGAAGPLKRCQGRLAVAAGVGLWGSGSRGEVGDGCEGRLAREGGGGLGRRRSGEGRLGRRGRCAAAASLRVGRREGGLGGDRRLGSRRLGHGGRGARASRVEVLQQLHLVRLRLSFRQKRAIARLCSRLKEPCGASTATRDRFARVSKSESHLELEDLLLALQHLHALLPEPLPEQPQLLEVRALRAVRLLRRARAQRRRDDVATRNVDNLARKPRTNGAASQPLGDSGRLSRAGPPLAPSLPLTCSRADRSSCSCCLSSWMRRSRSCTACTAMCTSTCGHACITRHNATREQRRRPSCPHGLFPVALSPRLSQEEACGSGE